MFRPAGYRRCSLFGGREAVGIEAPVGKAESIRVFPGGEMPHVPVVHADDPVHRGKIEFPAPPIIFEKVRRMSSMGQRETDHRPISGDQHPVDYRFSKIAQGIVLLGVGHHPGRQEVSRLRSVKGQVRVFDLVEQDLPVDGQTLLRCRCGPVVRRIGVGRRVGGRSRTDNNLLPGPAAARVMADRTKFRYRIERVSGRGALDPGNE